MIEFLLHGERYSWDSQSQRLKLPNGLWKDVHCEMDSGGLCSINKILIDGEICSIPSAFAAQVPDVKLRIELQNVLRTMTNKVLSAESTKALRKTVIKANWSSDDLAFIIVCTDSIARFTRDVQDKELFGKVVGLYLLTMAQTVLLYGILAPTFDLVVSTADKCGDQYGGKHSFDGSWRRTGDVFSDEDADASASNARLNSPLRDRAYTSLIDSEELDQLSESLASITLTPALRSAAESLNATDYVRSLRDWMTSLNPLTNNIFETVPLRLSPMWQNRRHAGTSFYAVLIGMGLYNFHALRNFRGGVGYAFADNRPSQNGIPQHFHLRDLGLVDLFRLQPESEYDRRAAGAYLHVLNLHPPVRR